MMQNRKKRRRAMPRLALPAPSLRGRPASLRTFPDGARWRLSKLLVWPALLAFGPVISSVRSIFVPALREAPASCRYGGYRRSRSEEVAAARCLGAQVALVVAI